MYMNVYVRPRAWVGSTCWLLVGMSFPLGFCGGPWRSLGALGPLVGAPWCSLGAVWDFSVGSRVGLGLTRRPAFLVFQSEGSVVSAVGSSWPACGSFCSGLPVQKEAWSGIVCPIDTNTNVDMRTHIYMYICMCICAGVAFL